MTENIERLPKWARQKIEVLEMRLREAKDKIALLSGNEPSKVYVRGWNKPDDQDRQLGDAATVAFVVKHGIIEARLDAEGGLYIAAYDGTLAIMPAASKAWSMASVL